MKEVELTSLRDFEKFIPTLKKRANAGDYFNIEVYGKIKQAGHGFMFSMKKNKKLEVRNLILVVGKGLSEKKRISGNIFLPLTEKKWKKEGVRKIVIEYGESRF